MILQPWYLLGMALANWLNGQQQAVIECLREENRVLREKLSRKRILLSNDQRRRLAIQGKALGRKLLSEIACLFTPATILAWHRKLVANKYDGSRNRDPDAQRQKLNVPPTAALSLRITVRSASAHEIGDFPIAGF